MMTAGAFGRLNGKGRWRPAWGEVAAVGKMDPDGLQACTPEKGRRYCRPLGPVGRRGPRC
ncbi:hypothetical protein CMI37_04650 [Candidatus Pacearchaeota archaeon]|nr:hypothetical protein [Candidatus Pacearchaeota archaeon]